MGPESLSEANPEVLNRWRLDWWERSWSGDDWTEAPSVSRLDGSRLPRGRVVLRSGDKPGGVTYNRHYQVDSCAGEM